MKRCKADTRKSGRREKSREKKKKQKERKTRENAVFSANQREQKLRSRTFSERGRTCCTVVAHHVPESANATSTCKINYKYSRANEFPSLVTSVYSSFRASSSVFSQSLQQLRTTSTRRVRFTRVQAGRISDRRRSEFLEKRGKLCIRK